MIVATYKLHYVVTNVGMKLGHFKSSLAMYVLYYIQTYAQVHHRFTMFTNIAAQYMLYTTPISKFDLL